MIFIKIHNACSKHIIYGFFQLIQSIYCRRLIFIWRSSFSNCIYRGSHSRKSDYRKWNFVHTCLFLVYK